MRLQRKLQRNLPGIGLAIASLALTIFQVPEILKNIDRMGHLTDRARQQGLLMQQTELQQGYLKDRAKVAVQRYQEGCLPVISKIKTNTLVSLSEGMRVVDPNTNLTYPVGTVVCSYTGSTGVINLNDNGAQVVTDIASTGDLQLVKKVLADHGISMTAGDRQFLSGAHVVEQGDQK